MKYAFLPFLIIIMGYHSTKVSQQLYDFDFITIEIEIGASAAEVWNIITNPDYAKVLGAVFDENAFQDSDWQPGSKVYFTYEPDNIVAAGTITTLIENQLIHVDYDFDGFDYVERYSLTSQDSGTVLQIYAGPYEEQYDTHKTVWNNWLQKVKELSEAV